MLQAWVMWNLCNMENKIISVERILQYTSIPSEPPLLIESNHPEPLWPAHGEVDIRSTGRTGSGKSTLIQTLFRILEPAAGQITKDDINISSIGLRDLRSRLNIFPWDPTMFERTVRSNLDPLEELWTSANSEMKLGKLDSTVTENGENWSMGQRQPSATQENHYYYTSNNISSRQLHGFASKSWAYRGM